MPSPHNAVPPLAHLMFFINLLRVWTLAPEVDYLTSMQPKVRSTSSRGDVTFVYLKKASSSSVASLHTLRPWTEQKRTRANQTARLLPSVVLIIAKRNVGFLLVKKNGLANIRWRYFSFPHPFCIICSLLRWILLALVRQTKEFIHCLRMSQRSPNSPLIPAALYRAFIKRHQSL